MTRLIIFKRIHHIFSFFMTPKKAYAWILLALFFLISWMLTHLSISIIPHRLLHQQNSPLYSSTTFLSDSAIIQRSSNCSRYFQFMADVFPKTHQQTETNFPLAFAISTYSQIGILELFLISSFDPLDSYCIHVDAKATEQVKTAVDQMIKCYQWKYPEATIFVVDDPIPVFWGHFSVLEADLKCMELLRTKNKEWKVVFNPAGTELPLKPIGQLRRYMADFPNGIVESFPVPKANRDRFLASYELKR